MLVLRVGGWRMCSFLEERMKNDDYPIFLKGKQDQTTYVSIESYHNDTGTGNGIGEKTDIFQRT